MIHLPSHPNQVCLTAFWLSFSMASSILGAALLYHVLASVQLSGIGFVSVPIVLLPLLLWEKGLMLCYRLWNRLAREVGRFAQKVILRICFHLVFRAAGFAGSSMTIDRPSPEQSLWANKETLGSSSYFGQHRVSPKRSPVNWVWSVASWSRQSRDLLPFCLLPFLLLLWALEPNQETEVSGDIYTLF
jgi:hypothetical protein